MTGRQGALLYQPSLWSDESVVSSYQIRLREANRLPTMGSLAAVLGARSHNISPQRLYTERDGIQLLELASAHPFRLADAMPIVLQGAQGPVLRWSHGALSIQFWMSMRAQVCPDCLRAHGYLDASLDFWHLPVCAEHQRVLIDRCTDCGTELSLDRQTLLYCQSCGANISEMQGATVSSQLSAVVERLSQLASVPVAQDGRTLLALNANEVAAFIAFFATGDYVEQEGLRLPGTLPGLSSEARLRGLKTVASCVDDHGLNLSSLRHFLLERASYIRPFLETPFFTWWLLSRRPPVQLGLHAANAIAFGEASDVAHLAVHQGHAALVRDTNELASHLGTDTCTAKDVAAGVGLTKSRAELAFDADQVLYAKRFFDASLPSQVLDMCFGIRGLTERLLSHRLLSRVGLRGEAEFRVDADSIVALLRRVRARVDSPCTDRGARLGDRDARDAGDALALVLSGAWCAADWPAPYRLADLRVAGPCR